MTVKLYQFPSAWGLPNPSPFCMKLEVFLRLAEIPYEIVTWPDPRKAPKGKLPFIEHEGNRSPIPISACSTWPRPSR